jgi:hypothetical protein
MTKLSLLLVSVALWACALPGLAEASTIVNRLELVATSTAKSGSTYICDATVSAGDFLNQIPFSLRTQCNQPLDQAGNAVLENFPSGTVAARGNTVDRTFTSWIASSGSYVTFDLTTLFTVHGHFNLYAPAGYAWAATPNAFIGTPGVGSNWYSCVGLATSAVSCTIKTAPFHYLP